jgi:3-phenylpropionate/trans-cinnamate dioxygenase ferredoxin reductase subunit
MKRVVIVGAGHGAAQLCGSLVDARKAGFECEIALVGDEAGVPYHRPPLSKAFLKTTDAEGMPIRAESYYQEHGIALHLGDAALAVDREACTVTLSSGLVLGYDFLVLATGARARLLPGVPPDTEGLYTLRSAAQAAHLRERLHLASSLIVIGGGFIGLEIAATAQALGKRVAVLESAPRLLTRALSPEMSDFLLQQHRANGIDVRLNVRLEKILIENGRAIGVEESANSAAPGEHAADLIVVGIGAEPEIELAKQAGLECGNGIVVDAGMRTSDSHILAIGDCTLFPLHGAAQHVRLEAIQNANDQARCAAATIAGQPVPYAALPWFWSEQGALRIQIAGLALGETERFVRGKPADGKFSVLLYQADKLVAVESVNLPADHLAARKLLEAGIAVAPALASDATIALNSHLPSAAPAVKRPVS